MSESYVVLRAELLETAINFWLNQHAGCDCVDEIETEAAFVRASVALDERRPIEIVYDRPAVGSETV
jgi:hypothetical protein